MDVACPTMMLHWSFLFVLSLVLIPTKQDNYLPIHGTPSYRLNDEHTIPAVALGTSLGHLANDEVELDVTVSSFSIRPFLSFLGFRSDMFACVLFIKGTRILSVNHSLARAVQWALEADYRHIDTAALYRTEDEVGLGVRQFVDNNNSGLTRKDIYITTKLWNDAHAPDDVIPALAKSLRQLQMDYVDLYLMHYPFAYEKNGSISLTDYLDTWRAMEEAVRLNLTRSIGVSNFNLKQMQRLWKISTIKPALLQIEVNPAITQNELADWCSKHGVVIMAYSPFGAILGRKSDAPPPRADDPTLMRIADKYKKTVAQILIRYLKNGSISLTDYLDTWRAMEEAVRLNLTRSIGVSNFNLKQMQRLWKISTIKPALLQIEVNPAITQNELADWCSKHGVVIMAYSPFGAILGRKSDAPPPRADDPTLMRIADKYKKTVAQILIRYLLDRNMIPIPRSTNKERIKENINVFDFTLTSEEIEELSQFNKNYRLRTPVKWYDHPEFPFEKKNLSKAEIEYILDHSVED